MVPPDSMIHLLRTRHEAARAWGGTSQNRRDGRPRSRAERQRLLGQKRCQFPRQRFPYWTFKRHFQCNRVRQNG
eukprot:990796-Rhodomonas_salina.1